MAVTGPQTCGEGQAAHFIAPHMYTDLTMVVHSLAQTDSFAAAGAFNMLGVSRQLSLPESTSG